MRQEGVVCVVQSTRCRCREGGERMETKAEMAAFPSAVSVITNVL